MDEVLLQPGVDAQDGNGGEHDDCCLQGSGQTRGGEALLGGDFHGVDVVDDVWNEYEKINNPVVAFIDDVKVDKEPVGQVFTKYNLWCVENGYKPLSKNKLSRELKKQGFESKVAYFNKVAKRYWSKEVKK